MYIDIGVDEMSDIEDDGYDMDDRNEDNCPMVDNAGQEDINGINDGDGMGDACEPGGVLGISVDTASGVLTVFDASKVYDQGEDVARLSYVPLSLLAPERITLSPNGNTYGYVTSADGSKGGLSVVDLDPLQAVRYPFEAEIWTSVGEPFSKALAGGAFSPDGTYFYALYEGGASDTIEVYRTTDLRAPEHRYSVTVNLGYSYTAPNSLLVTDSGYVYFNVTPVAGGGKTICIRESDLKGGSFQLWDTIDVGSGPRDLVIPLGSEVAYVTNVLDDTISVIDVSDETNPVIATLTDPDLDLADTGAVVGITPQLGRLRYVYVGASGSQTMDIFKYNPETGAFGKVREDLAVFDNGGAGEIAFHFTGGFGGNGDAHVYVTNKNGAPLSPRQIRVIEHESAIGTGAVTPELIGTFGDGPVGLAIQQALAVVPSYVRVEPEGETVFTAVGGVPPYTWTPEGGTVDPLQGEMVTYTAGEAAGPFTMTVTDSSVPAEQATATVDIQADVGRVILLAGGGDLFTNPELEKVQVMADHAYAVLLDRGFDGDKIFYAAPYASLVDPEQTNAVDVLLDGVDDLAEVRSAFYDWATAELSDGIPLYLIMIDHGGPDKFYLFQTTDPLLDSVYLEVVDTDGDSQNDLGVWLDHVQDPVAGCDTCRAIVIYEACYSGSVIAESVDPWDGTLSGANRVLITSSGPDQLANFRLDGLVSFSYFFFEMAGQGHSLLESFGLAKSWLSQYQFVDPQDPWLDDNGDADYMLDDGQIAKYLYLGVGANEPPLEFSETSIDRQIEVPGVGETVPVDVYGDLLNENALVSKTARLIDPEGGAGVAVEMDGVDDGAGWTADRYQTTLVFDETTLEGTYTVELDAEDIYGFKASTELIFIWVGEYQGDLYEENDTWQTAAEALLGVGEQVLNFHDQGDEDWFRIMGFQGKSYSFHTWTPGNDCNEPQVDTEMKLYEKQGEEIVEILDADTEYCGPPGGPDLILDWDCPEDGEYYLQIRNFYPTGYGPGTEYVLFMDYTQGDLFEVEVEVTEGGMELKQDEAEVWIRAVKPDSTVLDWYPGWRSIWDAYFEEGLPVQPAWTWTVKVRKAGTPTWSQGQTIPGSSIAKDAHIPMDFTLGGDPAYTLNAQAAAYGDNSVMASGLVNHLAYLLLPAGLAIGFRFVRRKSGQGRP